MTQKNAGFTLIEVLVTVVIAALFVMMITQVYLTQLTLNGAARTYYTADMLAYNNLRSYANGHSPSWFKCTYTGGVPDPAPKMSITDNVPGLPPPVTQTVVAYAPYGCGGGQVTLGYPIKVVSTVTYGPTGRTLTHATYVSY